MGLIALIVIFLKEEEEGARGNEMESQGTQAAIDLNSFHLSECYMTYFFPTLFGP